MLLGVHDDAGDRDDIGVAHRGAQQRVDAFGLGGRFGVVRTLEDGERDLACLHERIDLDGLRARGKGGLDLVLRDDDVVAVRLLDALDDVLGFQVLAGALVVALVADRIEAATVEPVEVDAGVLLGRIDGHGDVHEPEADRAFPDSPAHQNTSVARIERESRRILTVSQKPPIGCRVFGRLPCRTACHAQLIGRRPIAPCQCWPT